MAVEHDELEGRAERGELRSVPGTVVHGQAASAEGRSALLDATGASAIEEAMRLVLGCPRVGAEGRGPSPMWKVRTTPELDAELRAVAAKLDVTRPQVVRSAVAEYVRADA